MIISRSPMRLSFLGGTTDFRSYFDANMEPGRVLGTTIDQYVYITILEQPKFEKIKFRFSWRFTETVSDIHEISHPVLRTILEHEKWETPLNISTMASLPGRSGMGSSSAFTVSLLAAMNQLNGKPEMTKDELAERAVKIEREYLAEPGGLQDQYHAAVGGFRRYEFTRQGISWSEPIRDLDFRSYLSSCLVLVATGGGRDSGVHALRTLRNIETGEINDYLNELSLLTEVTYLEMINARNSEIALEALCEGMNRGWDLKRKISLHSNSQIDDLISFGISRGALAGKLCGAGGSGFAAFLVKPEYMNKFRANFNSDDLVEINLVDSGQEIILK